MTGWSRFALAGLLLAFRIGLLVAANLWRATGLDCWVRFLEWRMSARARSCAQRSLGCFYARH
jgi:hypothetical protein